MNKWEIFVGIIWAIMMGCILRLYLFGPWGNCVRNDTKTIIGAILGFVGAIVSDRDNCVGVGIMVICLFVVIVGNVDC